MASVMQLELQLPMQLMQQSLQLNTEQCLEMQAAVNCTTLNSSLKMSRVDENCILLLTGHVADLVEIVSRKWRCIVKSVAHPDTSSHDNSPGNSSLTILPHTDYTTLASITPVPINEVKEETQTEEYSSQSRESNNTGGCEVTKQAETSAQLEAAVTREESSGVTTSAKRRLWTPEKTKKTSSSSPSPHKVHCVLCQKVFKCLPALQSHLTKVHGKEWKDYLMEIDSEEVTDLAMGLDFQYLMSQGIFLGKAPENNAPAKTLKKSPKSNSLLACGECKERFTSESALLEHVEHMHVVREDIQSREDVQKPEQLSMQRVDVEREEQPLSRHRAEESTHNYECSGNQPTKNHSDQVPQIHRRETQSDSSSRITTSDQTPKNSISLIDTSAKTNPSPPCVSISSTNSPRESPVEMSLDSPHMDCSDLEDNSNDLENGDDIGSNVAAQEADKSGADEHVTCTISESHQSEHCSISKTGSSETLHTISLTPTDTNDQNTDAFSGENQNLDPKCCRQCGHKFKTQKALLCHLRMWCKKNVDKKIKGHGRSVTSSNVVQDEAEGEWGVSKGEKIETSNGDKKKDRETLDKSIGVQMEELDSQDATKDHDLEVKVTRNGQSVQRSNEPGAAEKHSEAIEHTEDPLCSKKRPGAGRRKCSKVCYAEDKCSDNVKRPGRKRKLDSNSKAIADELKLPQEKKMKKNQSKPPEEKKNRRKAANVKKVKKSDVIDPQDCEEETELVKHSGHNKNLSESNVESLADSDDDVASSEGVLESEMNDDCETDGSWTASESTQRKRGKKKYQPPKVKCCKCPRISGSVKDLRIHMHRMHKSCMSEHEIECYVEDQLAYGRFRFAKSTKMVCVFCQRERPGGAIFNHLEVWHKDEERYHEVQKEFQEQLRKFKVYSQRKLQMAVWGQKVKDGICCHCNKQFPSAKELKHHKNLECEKNKARRSQRLECFKCNYKAKDKEDFEVHRKTHPPGIQREWVCEICGNIYHYQGGLTTHRRVKHGIVGRQEDAKTEWECEKCGQKFRYKVVYERHLLTHTDTMGATCDICGKMYKTERDLSVHRKRIHLNIYPYHCDKCGHGLQRKEWLLTHRCENVKPRRTRERGKKAEEATKKSSKPKKQQTREDLLQKLMTDVNIPPQSAATTSSTTSSKEPQQNKNPEPPPQQQSEPLTSGGYLDTTQFSLERARSLFPSPMSIQPPSLTNYNPFYYSPSVQPPMPLLSSFTENPDAASETESNAGLASQCQDLRAKDVPWPEPSWLNEGT